MDDGMWIAHASLSATVGVSIAALCCAAVMLVGSQADWREPRDRPTMLLCFMLGLAVTLCALNSMPSLDPHDLANALVIGWGIVLARRARAQLIRFTRDTWWSPSP